MTCATAQPPPSGELRAAAGARHCRASDAAQCGVMDIERSCARNSHLCEERTRENAARLQRCSPLPEKVSHRRGMCFGTARDSDGWEMLGLDEPPLVL
ncbi:hypothetical protein [Rubritalea tangerina]|uniref:hypothetical protein n=1 Tax=Rubritalea tangerina TaxID=430798 RepID=UPI00360C3553